MLLILALSSASAPPAHCADQTQSGLNICAQGEARAAETELNMTYRQLHQKLAVADRDRLTKAERNWIAWRDAECLMRTGGGGASGGSIAPMLIAACFRDLARSRTRDLRELLQCGPGDLSCPG